MAHSQTASNTNFLRLLLPVRFGSAAHYVDKRVGAVGCWWLTILLFGYDDSEMKPDPDYIKKILTAFQDAPGPTVKFLDLAERCFPGEVAELYFHLRLLSDQGFVRREDNEPGIGVTSRSDGSFEWPESSQLRLTASGHEFADALNNSKALRR